MQRILYVALARAVAPAMTEGALVPLSVDPSDGGLRVHVENGAVGGGGTEYTEGDTDATITGQAILWEDAADTLRAVSSAKPLPVNVVAGSTGNSAASSTNAAVPSSAGYTGANVGGNLQGVSGYDADSGAGTEYVLGVVLRKSASGGSVELGTLTNPVRVDPTNTTAQQVTVNAADNVIGRVKITDGTDVADVFNLTNADPLAVAIVDANGDQVTSFGGGTTYTEDAASAADPIGPMMMAVRKDALAAITSTDGDNIAVRATNKGEVYVKQTDAVPVTDNGGSLTVDGTVAVSGTVAVTQSGTWDEVGINDSGNSITVDAPVGTPVFVRLSDGSSAIATLPVSIAATVTVSEVPATSGGLSIYSFLSTAAVQAAAIKASAGQVYGLHFFNNTATVCYVRLYNMTTAPATTDTVVYRAIIPANTSGAGFVVPIPPGMAFSSGIGIRVTAAVADNDATALAANAILGNVLYK